MPYRSARVLLPAAFLILSTLAGAADTSPVASMPPPRPAKADPLDAGVAVPPASHEPAFKRYRPHRDEAPRSWKDANDEVARIGGWRAYAREAAQPDAPAVPASAPSGHGHH
jgi:hypothetical protein